MSRSMAKATNMCPGLAVFFHSLYIGPTSWLMAAPLRMPQRISTMRPRPYPFASAAGRSDPLARAAGSVVGIPLASSATPSGSRPPEALRLRIVEPAIDEVEKSTRIGSPDEVGQPNATGFVPKTAFRPPWGVTFGVALVKARPAHP